MIYGDLLAILNDVRFYDDKDIALLDNKTLLNYYIALKESYPIIKQFTIGFSDSLGLTNVELGNRMKGLSTDILEAELERQSSENDVEKLAKLWVN